MFERISFNVNRVYPTLVVSTMSSGKSTLINALIGEDILPSMNQACTARALAILDNDMRDYYIMHTVDKNGTHKRINHISKKDIADINNDENIKEILVEGEIKGIKNSKKSLLLIDTPGVNNSMNINHEKITKTVMSKYSEGLMLYVLNAQQFGTYDDKTFLSSISKKIRENDKFKIIFVINKMDLLDPRREEPIEFIGECQKYIVGMGIENPIIIPVSASSALLFKKVLYGKKLSEMEEEEFRKNYKYFKNEGFSLQNYLRVPDMGNLNEIVIVDDIQYKRHQLYAALENTGIPFLERTIDETLVKSLKMKAPRITIRRNM